MYSVDKDYIATVDHGGLIKAVAPGIAIVTGREGGREGGGREGGKERGRKGGKEGGREKRGGGERAKARFL